MPSPQILGLCVLAFCASVQAATRHFSIEVEWAERAPDGFSRQQIVVNGTSPGPALIIDEGDDVEVRMHPVSSARTALNLLQFYVHNCLDEPTTVHFHGIE
jgi:FtsP/CotA-like multicopper oxidase with cupredoxin domain